MRYLILALLLSSCGPTGPNGDEGVQGQRGTTGANGLNGINGTNGTTVTPIILCPGFVPSYPNTFPEYALCLQNKLYGVYSDHSGFLAMLPPGRYYSDGINASCTFNVGSNCTVTP